MIRRSPLVIVPPVLILVAAASIFKESSWSPMAIYLDPKVLEFGMGMAVARGTELFRPPPWLGGALVLAGLVLFFLSAELVDWPEFCARAFAAWAFVAGFVWLEPLLKQRVGKPLLFLGAASYALYLTHPIFAPAVPVALKKLGLFDPNVSIAGCIVVGLVVSSAIHLVFEAPIMVAGSKWLKKGGFDSNSQKNVPPELSSPTP
jgi:peptidoglycan/LPS O-acetylase OafA/YrhL